MIYCLYNPRHKTHHPPHEVFNGDHDAAQEIPDRALNIFTALRKEKYEIVKDTHTVPRALLLNIHDKEYLDFLEKTSQKLQAKEYLYPSVWSYNPTAPRIADAPNVRLLGTYVFDTYTPLLRGTYEAVTGSASLAYTAAMLIRQNPKETYYALCRPPGHHAERAMAGGYCYINNAAVAAQYLSQFGKVATLDVDFHHGNGTQHIFYDRDDVLTVSIHADPARKFPFYSGFAREGGTGKGGGYNRNFPLQQGTDNQAYDTVLRHALSGIRRFKPQFLVVSYGADTHISDPIGGFQLSTDYFTQMGKQIKSLGLPTVIVQEGGYNNEHLGANVTAFLKGFV